MLHLFPSLGAMHFLMEKGKKDHFLDREDFDFPRFSYVRGRNVGHLSLRNGISA